MNEFQEENIASKEILIELILFYLEYPNVRIDKCIQNILRQV